MDDQGSYLPVPQSPTTPRSGPWSAGSGGFLLPPTPQNPPRQPTHPRVLTLQTSAMPTSRHSQNRYPPPRNGDPNSAPETPKPLPAEVRDKYPIWTYGKFLSFLSLILFLPLCFSLALRTTGAIAAPMTIVNFTRNNPRITPQLITAIGSTLTISVKWGFAGAITTYARKHLQRSHPVRHIELFSALKNGALVWSWDTTRLLSKAGTLTAVVLGGLLTSGFVALISPFPVAKERPINAGTLAEFDLASRDASCFQWAQDTHTINNGHDFCTDPLRYSNTSLVYYNCTFRIPSGDEVTSVESAMIYRYASSMPSQQLSNFVKSFPLLLNTRLIGGTAGTLPQGPRGIDVFPNSALPFHPTTSSFNYTLELRGVWAESSCSYTKNPSLFVPESSQEESRPTTLNCASGDRSMQWDNEVFSEAATGMIMVGICYNKRSDTATVHFRSLFTPKDKGIPPASGSRVYAGIGAVECSFAPRTGIVNATYQTDLAAFNMTRPTEYTPFSSMGPLAQSIVVDGMEAMLIALSVVRTEWSGNRFGGVIYNVARLYGNLTGDQQDPMILELLADGLVGLFEFQMSLKRLRLAAFQGRPPNQTCFRPVTGKLIETHLGWNYAPGIALGLVPLVIICLISIGLILWTIAQSGQLTLFDPTEPVSLIAAAGDGKLRFVPDASQNLSMEESRSLLAKQTSPIGDPDDKFVKNTKVIYGDEDGTWGLRAKTE